MLLAWCFLGAVCLFSVCLAGFLGSDCLCLQEPACLCAPDGASAKEAGRRHGTAVGTPLHAFSQLCSWDDATEGMWLWTHLLERQRLLACLWVPG